MREVCHRIARVRWIFRGPDYQSSTLLTILRANTEIMRRLDTGKLSALQEQRLIELFLAEQGQPILRLNPGGQAIRKLGPMYAAGRLSAEQGERFRRQSMHYALRADAVFPSMGPWSVPVAEGRRMPAQFIADDKWLVEYACSPERRQINGNRGMCGSGSSVCPLTLDGFFTPGIHRGQLTIIVTLNTDNGAPPEGPLRPTLRSAAEGDPKNSFVYEYKFDFTAIALPPGLPMGVVGNWQEARR